MKQMNTYIGIRQFFTRQTFPNPDLSKFSTIKNLRHMVASYCILGNFHASIMYFHEYVFKFSQAATATTIVITNCKSNNS